MLLFGSELGVGLPKVAGLLAPIELIMGRRGQVKHIFGKDFNRRTIFPAHVVCHNMRSSGKQPGFQIGARAASVLHSLQQAHENIAGDILGDVLIVVTIAHITIDFRKILVVNRTDDLRVQILQAIQCPTFIKILHGCNSPPAVCIRRWESSCVHTQYIIPRTGGDSACPGILVQSVVIAAVIATAGTTTATSIIAARVLTLTIL